MIKFTELRVSNGHLYISAEVRDLEYYENVYINDIKIDTQDTFVSTGISSDTVYEYTFTGNQKSIHLDINMQGIPGSASTAGEVEKNDFNNININQTMFFVYAEAKGTPSPEPPCGGDNSKSLGITFALCPIYNQIMAYIKGVENTCEIPMEFVNLMLQYKAIQYSINSGHFLQAARFYKKFYGDLPVTSSRNCGCHG